MPIQISCPSYARQLRVPDNLIGQTVKCPSCQNVFTAEAAASPPPGEAYRESSAAYQDEPPRRDDEPPRPDRGRDRDDDYDDRPRRRRYAPHRGTLILILGILGLVGIGAPITGIIAWILGNSDLAQMRAGAMDPEGESNTSLGRILGMIATLLWAIGLFGFCCCIGFGVMSKH